MTLGLAVLLFVTLQRGGELVLARRNTRRLLKRGALEASPGHYPLIVLVHAGWLIALWVFGWNKPVQLGWLSVFAGLQVCRLWVLATLGERWTTRIVVLPGAAPIRHGPYRFVSHPNYWVVAGEIAVLPLAFGLPFCALVFSTLNAVVLAIRIRAENRALTQQQAADEQTLGGHVRQGPYPRGY